MSQREMIAAIEIGGTKLQLALAAAEPTGATEGQSRVAPFVRQERLAIAREEGAAGILRQIESVLARWCSESDVTGIGIGFGGPVDGARGRTLLSHQVAGWDDFGLAEWCVERWHVPVVVDNDCNVAALAEARYGAGRGARRVFYVTVGTGIGGGWIVDGRIDGQSRPAIAEIGHLRPGLSAIDAHATVEACASGLGLEQIMTARLTAWRDGHDPAPELAELAQRLQWPQQPMRAQQIVAAASAGNGPAREIWAEATRTLGWALAQVTTLLAPDVIVIGGGVSLSGDSFFTPVRAAWQQYVFPPLREHCQILAAGLGEEVVLHGAVALAQDARGSRCASA